MDKVFRIVKREYLSKVKKKSFLITTFLMPLLIIGMIALVVFFIVTSGKGTKTIAVVDDTGQIAKIIAQEIDVRNPEDKTEFIPMILHREGDAVYTENRSEYGMLDPEAGVTDWKKIIIKKVETKEISGFIYLQKDALKTNTVEYYTRNVASFTEKDDIQDMVYSAFKRWRIKNKGWDQAEVSEVLKGMKLVMKRPVTAPGKEDVEEKGQTFAITLIMAIMLYMMMLLYGANMMTSVIREKTSRLVEILLSSVRPFQLFSGKLLGVGLVGITQFALWILTAYLFIQYGGVVFAKFGLDFDLDSVLSQVNIPSRVIVFFVVFFILGYYLYATLYITIGAMVNSSEEAQQMSMPVTILLVLGYFGFQYVLKAPDSSIAIVLSMIPFFTPLLMFARVGAMMPPPVQVYGSIAIMLVTIVVITWISSKIYRVGILMYGKRPNLPEVLKWIRHS